MISNKFQFSSKEKSDSTIDLLADRVQSLLDKTIKFQTENANIYSFSDQQIPNEQIISSQTIHSNDNNEQISLISFDNVLDEPKFSENQNFTSQREKISSPVLEKLYPSLSEFIINYNDYDDLTEYLSIPKTMHHLNINPKYRNDFVFSSEIDSLSDSTNYKLSDIILHHKKFLNTQMNHLKKLSLSLARIEKFLLESSQIGMDNKRLLEKKVNCSRKNKIELTNFSISSDHSSCNHSNNVLKRQQKISKLYNDCSLFHLNQVKNCCFANKQHTTLKNSIQHMIRKIDQLLNNYEMDLINKSVQNSSICYGTETSQNEIKKKQIAISWFLNFENPKTNYYKIEPQCINLQELFDRNCQKFKIRSLMRALRIKDNTKLRIETADQRKEEIVQVYLLQKKCLEENRMKKIINSKKPKQSTIVTSGDYRIMHSSRPLSPIMRRNFTHRQMRKQTEKLYQRLPEAKSRINNGNREDEAKRSRLMANIFKQKLKDNAVRGKLNWPITSQAISA